MRSVGFHQSETATGTLLSVITGLFQRSQSRSLPVATQGAERDADPVGPGCRRVRLLRDPTRQPGTRVERLAIAVLEREGAVLFEPLVEQLARALYHDALLRGAWIVDIGIMGWKSFIPEVTAELEAASGLLWKIETGEGVY